MTIRALYFASLRDRMGKREEIVELADGMNVLEFWQLLVERHPALAGAPRPAFARNAVYVGAGEIVRDGDAIAFLPAVSGG